MEKTLYEILEVSEKASKEVIDKAYRVLAKKYHPDLQEEGFKQEAENYMKEINEAYSILGDEEKRKQYDNKLNAERQYKNNSRANTNSSTNSSNEYKSNNNSYSYNTKSDTNTAYNNTRNDTNTTYNKSNNTVNDRGNNVNNQYNNGNVINDEDYEEKLRRQEEEFLRKQQIQENLQAQYERKYQVAYENYLRSLGYKIKYKWTWENYRDLLIIIVIIVVAGLVLWFLPPTRKILIDFYNSNPIITAIIDTVFEIIKGIWNGICSIFSKK